MEFLVRVVYRKGIKQMYVMTGVSVTDVWQKWKEQNPVMDHPQYVKPWYVLIDEIKQGARFDM